jgi:hypothetical protein
MEGQHRRLRRSEYAHRGLVSRISTSTLGGKTNSSRLAFPRTEKCTHSPACRRGHLHHHCLSVALHLPSHLRQPMLLAERSRPLLFVRILFPNTGFDFPFFMTAWPDTDPRMPQKHTLPTPFFFFFRSMLETRVPGPKPLWTDPASRYTAPADAGVPTRSLLLVRLVSAPTPLAVACDGVCATCVVRRFVEG